MNVFLIILGIILFSFMGNIVGWALARNDNYLFNWRVLFGPTVYRRWYDRYVRFRK